jgi:putative DNA primase/helicase
VPYIAALKNGELTYRASSRNPNHWKSFERALEVLENSDASGIGYAFSENDPFAVADFDDALVDGAMEPKIAALLEELDTYTEVSVSGNGLHVICEAEVGAGAAIPGYEIYDRGRYIAMTGDVYGGRDTIQSRYEPFRKLTDDVRDRQRRMGGPQGTGEAQSGTQALRGSRFRYRGFPL